MPKHYCNGMNAYRYLFLESIALRRGCEFWDLVKITIEMKIFIGFNKWKWSNCNKIYCRNSEKHRFEIHYSRFQVTFHCKIPNFVAKFGSSLRSSKVHFRIRKPVCKLSIWLASLSSGANHSLCLQTGLWILKWTFELRNELPNFTTKFGTLQWKVIWNRL